MWPFVTLRFPTQPCVDETNARQRRTTVWSNGGVSFCQVCPPSLVRSTSRWLLTIQPRVESRKKVSSYLPLGLAGEFSSTVQPRDDTSGTVDSPPPQRVAAITAATPIATIDSRSQRMFRKSAGLNGFLLGRRQCPVDPGGAGPDISWRHAESFPRRLAPLWPWAEPLRVWRTGRAAACLAHGPRLDRPLASPLARSRPTVAAWVRRRGGARSGAACGSINLRARAGLRPHGAG